MGRPCRHTREAPVADCRMCQIAEENPYTYGLRWDGLTNLPEGITQQTERNQIQNSVIVDASQTRLTRRQIIKARLTKIPCIYLGNSLDERRKCVECGRHGKLIEIFACPKHGQCTVDGAVDKATHCLKCNDYVPRTTIQLVQVNQESPSLLSTTSEPTSLILSVNRPTPLTTTNTDHLPLSKRSHNAKGLIWSYGITTTPQRRMDLLPRTIASLGKAGFNNPRLFVDGLHPSEAIKWQDQFKLEITAHWPSLRTFGNWITALWELYLRSTGAHRYAIFQDDLVTVENLKTYLDRTEYPHQGYMNLYTFPENQYKAPNEGRTTGWFKSNQKGKGAVALIFSNEAVRTLLGSRYIADRPTDAARGHRAIDGGIVSAFNKLGWNEYCHNPSLVQHTGKVSSMKNGPQPLAPSFPGEEFNALKLLS